MNVNSHQLPRDDSDFIAYLRGFAIIIVVFGHVGGFWVFRPYSEFLHVVIPIFFFLSGSVLFFSYERQQSVTRYYIKRALNLLVPYYLLCLLSLFTYYIITGSSPDIKLKNILLWLQIRPDNEIMVFPVGQVWFLHTFLCIILLSPFYFYLRKKHVNVLLIIMLSFIAISGVQLFFDISSYMRFFGNNIYKPVVHSSFFIFGIFFATLPIVRNKIYLATYLVGFILISILVAYSLNLNIDYAYHTYAPDLYYVAGSFAAIISLIILNNKLTTYVRKVNLIKKILLFFNHHTFSIYLLHSFVIYLFENFLYAIGYNNIKISFSYGIYKFISVTFATCLLSLPFTKLSSSMILFLEKKLASNFQMRHNT